MTYFFIHFSFYLSLIKPLRQKYRQGELESVEMLFLSLSFIALAKKFEIYDVLITVGLLSLFSTVLFAN